MQVPLPVRVRFDAFVLDPARGLLLREGERLSLRRQALEVLAYLASNAGKVVRSEDVVAAVWSARPADPTASVAQCVKEIRQALGKDGRWIVKTVTGKGYQLVAEVVSADVEAPVVMLKEGVADESPSVPKPPPEAALQGRPVPIDLAPAASGPVVAQPVNPVVAKPVRDAGHEDRSGSSWLDKSAEAARRFGRHLAESSAGRHRRAFALALIVILLSGTLYNGRPTALPVRSSSLTMMSEPTIALAPFNAAGQAESGVGAALGDEVRAELSRSMRGFDLLIRSVGSPSAGQPAAADLGRFGIRYLVTGTTRLENRVLLATLQLLEAETGRLVWSAPYEIPKDDARAFNRSAVRIAQTIVLQVRAAEVRRPLPKKPEAGHYILLARSMSQARHAAGPTLEAKALFERALELDPNSVRAMEGSAMTILRAINTGYIHGREGRVAAAAKAKATIDRLLSIDAGSAVAHMLRGELYRWHREWDKALAAYEYSLTLNPNQTSAHSGLARTKIELGRSQEALGHVEDVLALHPSDSFNAPAYFFAGMAAVHLGNDRAAVQWLLKAQQADNAYQFSALWLAIAYAGIGEMDKARASLAEFTADRHDFSVAQWKANVPTQHPVVAAQRQRIAGLLRRIGLPDTASAQKPAPTTEH